MAAHDRDLEMGAIDNSGASVAAPGSYVTQMRAANNPGDGNVEGVTNKRTSPPAASPAQPNRGMPPHYGIEGEPQCCLCSKIGRLFIVTLVLGIAALIFVYIYWTDISKLNGNFLDASTHLYKRLCPSVDPSVGPFVGPSVGWSVSTFF